MTYDNLHHITFQSTPSAWRETLSFVTNPFSLTEFQSTPSAWRETFVSCLVYQVGITFQSTPSAWRETGADMAAEKQFENISIHSLRMEGDACSIPDCRTACISIHSLRMEGDCFLAVQDAFSSYFNPLPPHGGRPDTLPYIIDVKDISIHSLRMEGDTSICSRADTMFRFQSTPSAWRETVLIWQRKNNLKTFQSTPSAWRETPCAISSPTFCVISIHSLRMEGDIIFERVRTWERHFNPLPPHGGRLQKDVNNYVFRFISIHSLRMEGDFMRRSFEKGYDISIHSLRMEGDRNAVCYNHADCISIHSLRMEGDDTRLAHDLL